MALPLRYSHVIYACDPFHWPASRLCYAWLHTRPTAAPRRPFSFQRPVSLLARSPA